jgi:hypothetical protein
MAKIKLNIINQKKERTSILVDQFLFDLCVFSYKRKITYQRYLKDKNDTGIISDKLNDKIRSLSIYQPEIFNGKTLTELCHQILITHIASRHIIDLYKNQN